MTYLMRNPIRTYRQRMTMPGRTKKKKLLSSQICQDGSSSIAQNADSNDELPDSGDKKNLTLCLATTSLA
ncbi:jg24163 [Pararge aegeria aegeria]|uniref:Jg24163 protein n=1 Tax=Pararge aegeria aegeria TaxID=348720 RepID=A0A8S4S7G0_9NEOP|nr:jg24163 [Pararge aegeria aegeria]